MLLNELNELTILYLFGVLSLNSLLASKMNITKELMENLMNLV